jgi:hypothetical protein
MSSTWTNNFDLSDEELRDLRLIQTKWRNLFEMNWSWSRLQAEDEEFRVQENLKLSMVLEERELKKILKRKMKNRVTLKKKSKL